VRLVRVRFEKPLPAFGSVEYREPEYECVWFETSPAAVVVKHVQRGETVLVPWSRVVEAWPEPGGTVLNDEASNAGGGVLPRLPTVVTEEVKTNETGTVEQPKRRRR